MELRKEDEGLIRRYLLAQLTEDEREQFERRMMTDTELFDQMLLSEDDLVDDYARGQLTETDRQAFESSFLSDAEGRSRVNLAKSLRRYVEKNSALNEAVWEQLENSLANEEELAQMESIRGQKDTKSPRRPRWWQQPGFGSYVKLAAAAVIVIGVGLGIWRGFFYQSEVSKGIAALAHAYREQRPVEARITGFNYAPAANVRGDEEKVDRVARNRAERILLDEVSDHPSSGAHHALGKLYLAERKFDDAIEQFEEALKKDPKNAQVHSDYGAALMEKGKEVQSKGESGRSFELFARSIEHLSRALELNGSLLDALFNRALCREYTSANSLAREDWRTYLEKDQNSKWADEARQKLQALDERSLLVPQDSEQVYQSLLDACRDRDDERIWRIVTQNRDSAGNFIESRLVDDFLAPAGRVEPANQSIDALLYAGLVEYKHSGDRFISDLAFVYKQATPSRLNRLSQAHLLIKSARGLYSKLDFDGALELYVRAKQEFDSAGDVAEARYIDYMIGSCYLGQTRPEVALGLFQPLAQACDRAGYKWLLAQTLTSLSNSNQYFRDFSAAINNTNRALSLFEKMTDRVGAINSRYQLSEIYRFLNNGSKALDLQAGDLALATVYLAKPGQLWTRYFSLSRTLDQLGMREAAIDLQREAIQFATGAKAPRLICRSYNALGLMLAKRGDYAGASSSIERAIEIGNSLAEGRVRLEATAYSFLQLGQVFKKAGNFDKAVENYNQAIKAYDELDSKFFGFTARKDKLLCCMEQSRCPNAKQEMETMLNLFESQRAQIFEEGNRNTFFDAEQSIYDVAIQFEFYDENNPVQSFEYSERSRGRSLNDLINSSPRLVDAPDPDVEFSGVSQQMRLDQIRARIPEQVRLLQYAVLKDSVVIWVVSKNGLSSASQRITIEALERQVNDLVQLIANGSENDLDALRQESIGLHDILIKPIEDKLDDVKQLCIVPDKILNYLPFGALLSGASGKYFTQDYDFVLAPSASIFVACSEFAREKETVQSEAVACVGNPSFDHSQFPNLPDLRGATKEAAEVAGYYGSGRAITGASATKRRVVGEMEKADVIHLATHAIAEEGNPMRSKLLLAVDSSNRSGRDGDGVLQAYEIYKLNLARARLVVLSACRTAVERYYGGEGMIGLSRPFIAKRIPLVVASLWPVNSEATARLMMAFHRLRKVEGNSTVRALSSAQREMIESSNADNRLPCNWAAFVSIGGFARF